MAHIYIAHTGNLKIRVELFISHIEGIFLCISYIFIKFVWIQLKRIGRVLVYCAPVTYKMEQNHLNQLRVCGAVTKCPMWVFAFVDAVSQYIINKWMSSSTPYAPHSIYTIHIHIYLFMYCSLMEKWYIVVVDIEIKCNIHILNFTYIAPIQIILLAHAMLPEHISTKSIKQYKYCIIYCSVHARICCIWIDEYWLAQYNQKNLILLLIRSSNSTAQQYGSTTTIQTSNE